MSAGDSGASGSTGAAAHLPPTLRTERLILAAPQASHAAATLAFFERNREHLRPWDPPHPEGFFTPAYWEKNARSTHADFLAGMAVRFNLFAPDDMQTLIGRVNFSQISRAAFQSCMLGYAMDAQQQGKGLMHEALQRAIGYMFTEQKLHRVAASYLPENVRSAAVLKRLGFQVEGLGKRYLFINGQWRDHVLSALINPAFAADQLLMQ
jgi:[ribosomal protein S5]-alanine N-acetyltransferase